MQKIVYKSNLDYMDYMRAFAILIVVGGHTLLFGHYKHHVWNSTVYFFGGGTFLFVFIAGFLFQYLSYKFNYISYLKKKFSNVILPYWLTILPVAVIFAFTCNDKINFFHDKALCIKLLNPLLWGEIVAAPLWFIPMIVVIFLVAPLLIRLFRCKVLWYSLLLFGLIYISYQSPYVLDFDALVRHGHSYSILRWNIYCGILNIGRTLHFLPVYMLGMTICDIAERYFDYIKTHSLVLSKIFFISYVMCYFLFVWILELSNGQQPIKALLLTFSVLFFFMGYEDKIRTKLWLYNTLKFLAKYSFGIFFVHMYFANLLFQHTVYRKFDYVYYQYNYENSILCLLHVIGDFVFVLAGSILLLLIIKFILTKLGVKNTRKFIGA